MGIFWLEFGPLGYMYVYVAAQILTVQVLKIKILNNFNSSKCFLPKLVSIDYFLSLCHCQEVDLSFRLLKLSEG